ncbi:MAG: hypothetical protein WAL90_00030 [Desulfobacterales bacterium]
MDAKRYHYFYHLRILYKLDRQVSDSYLKERGESVPADPIYSSNDATWRLPRFWSWRFFFLTSR